MAIRTVARAVVMVGIIALWWLIVPLTVFSMMAVLLALVFKLGLPISFLHATMGLSVAVLLLGMPVATMISIVLLYNRNARSQSQQL